MDITLLELSFPDAAFNAPFAGATSDDDTVDASSPAGNGSSPNAGPVVALLVLLGLALLARYLRSRGNGPTADDAAD